MLYVAIAANLVAAAICGAVGLYFIKRGAPWGYVVFEGALSATNLGLAVFSIVRLVG